MIELEKRKWDLRRHIDSLFRQIFWAKLDFWKVREFLFGLSVEAGKLTIDLSTALYFIVYLSLGGNKSHVSNIAISH
ncbi:hypothetical protein [Psychromonas sp. Urea-02u-13]|uniref:hypothetical protein n=1 Tax=Psychromonas sp. Urea-02u-13 TaxID=2058326 RepID=UPI000C323E78|nr:hypothetical protein [Psychromonas sp. Urea-02u-13]PKG39667.1 hypothetical protein CXF74_07400 [Psychromonas sp. Urea-02u-13]